MKNDHSSLVGPTYIAERLNISEHKARRMLRNATFKGGFKVLGEWRCPVQSLEDYIAAQQSAAEKRAAQ